jgi:hypothetical protein
MTNVITPKTIFIMNTQKEIESMIKKYLHKRMVLYRKKYDFTHEDMFMWHACSISYAICLESARQECCSTKNEKEEKNNGNKKRK